MEDNFARCLTFVRSEEGGRSDDPADHGGRTAFGITQREYWADQDRRSIPHSDVWLISEDDIQRIYHQYYWNPFCPQLPDGVDLVFFDLCVNGGRGQAAKTLQRALGGVPVDGVIGVRTIAAAEASNPEELVTNYSMWRERFYRALKQFPHYGNGWLGRNNRCKNLALSMARSTPHPIKEVPKVDEIEADSITLDNQPEVLTDSPKALPDDTAQPMISPEQAGGASAGFGSASGIVNQISNQLSPYQYTIHVVEYVLLALAAASIGFMIYGIIKRSKIKAVT